MTEVDNNETIEDVFIPDDIEPTPDLDPNGTVYTEAPIKYYWKNGFYISSVNKTIPEDAVEISEELYKTLLNGQDDTHKIRTSEDGQPSLEEVDNSAKIVLYAAFAAYRKLRDALEMKETQLSIDIDDDATAFSIAPICNDWVSNHHYEKGEIINHKDVPYRVVQSVDSLEIQPPDADGMLAIYRPLDPAKGTLEDPKTFRLGMDVHKDLYYAYNGKIYLAKADMIPCTWSPDTVGMWQWEEVVSN